ncbi:MAG TPA: DUF2341 domain-containing protein [Candidatus Dormibacteraeota bacterium]|nr:DUF2341 domain-containing protein [Candidatus Dormibacteraeota bacterium]
MRVRPNLNQLLRWVLAWLVAIPMPLARADEVTTVTSTADATIDQSAPATNFGGTSDLSTRTAIGANNRAVLRFNLGAINPAAAVKTSRLNLTLTTAPFVSRSEAVHRITGATDWTENGVTWNTHNGATAWTLPGGDFDLTPTDTKPSGTTLGAKIQWNVLSDSTSQNIPQGWLNGTIANRGLLVKDQTESGSPDQWFAAGWQFNRQVTVTVGANAPFNGYNGYSAQLTAFDTSALIAAGKMRANCNDLRIARFSSGAWSELDRQILNCNTASTTVWFKIRGDIAASSSDSSYYVYYGNPSANAGPANLNNVYLFWDDFEADTVAQPPAGWTIQAGGPWVVQLEGTNHFLRRTAAGGAIQRQLIKVSSVTNEQDVFVQADVRMTSAPPAESLACVGGRYGGTSAADITAYRSCLQDLNQVQTQLATYLNGVFQNDQQIPFAWADNTYYTLAGAFFGNPSTLRNLVNGILQQSFTTGVLNNVSGSVGLISWVGNQTDYDYDNFLARRYTEPEPTIALGPESLQGPRYGSRSDVAANRPTLDVHYLRDATLNPAAPGISEVRLNWTFPAGSSAANYDGVLFAKRPGSVAPTFSPNDGTNYVVGAQPVLGESIAANTASFATVSVVDENGADSIVWPGTQYTYKGYTHDANTITGAASSVPPHYAFGVVQSSATITGGGANKNWSYKTAATTLAAPAIDPGVVIVTGGNDSKVHSMSPLNGGRNYQPGGVTGIAGGAIQTRPSVISSLDTSNSTCANVCDIAYASGGDGRVYAFRTDTGVALPGWPSAVLTTGAGSGLQGGTAIQVKSFSNAGFTLGFDLVIVGTRNVGSATNNKIVGLNGNTGTIVWTANTPNLDFISSTPLIDYTNNAIWVTSRSNGGTQPSLWEINSNTGTVLASFNLGDVDQSPTMSFNGNVLYVLENNSPTGSVIDAIRTDLANCRVAFNLGNIIPVGFPIPINTSATDDDIYFSSTTNVRKVHFTHGAACGGTFTNSPGGWTNPAIAAPSAPTFTPVPLPLFLYVGSSDGHLYKINPVTGANMANRLVNAGAIIGEPTFDGVNLKFYVGDSSGRVYSFDLF